MGWGEKYYGCGAGGKGLLGEKMRGWGEESYSCGEGGKGLLGKKMKENGQYQGSSIQTGHTTR